MEGEKDSTPKYDKDGKTSLDPEAGDGAKYVIEKRVRLISGTHKPKKSSWPQINAD